MKSPGEILVQFWYGSLDSESIRKWAYEVVGESEDNPEEIFELLDAAKPYQESLLLKLAKKSDPEFSRQSKGAEILAAKYLISVATCYLDGEIGPMDVCNVVNAIDSGFLDAPRDLPEKVAYCPEWLGNLYNSCDWCDETWSATSSPHLAEDLKLQIGNIRGWLEKS